MMSKSEYLLGCVGFCTPCFSVEFVYSKVFMSTLEAGNGESCFDEQHGDAVAEEPKESVSSCILELVVSNVGSKSFFGMRVVRLIKEKPDCEGR